MKHTMEEVKNFVNQFIELEYQVGLARFDASISDDQWDSMLKDLENNYAKQLNYYAMVSVSHRNKDYMNSEELENKRRNLKKRRLFLIRKYENPVFGKGIIDADASVMWSCFLGANVEMGAEVYGDNMSVGLVNGELKILSERVLNSAKRKSEGIIEWMYQKQYNIYLEDIVIKKDGKLVDTLRVVEPALPHWLEDYNS